MPTINATRTGTWTLVHYVRLLCRLVTKWQTQIEAVFDAVITDPTDKAAAKAFLTTVVTVCAILERWFPGVPA